MTLTSTVVNNSHRWFVLINEINSYLRVQNDKRTNKDDNFRETNTAFSVHGDSACRTTRPVDIRLLPSSIPWLIRSNRINNYSYMMEYSSPRYFNVRWSAKTFAGPNTLGPCMLELCVASISTVREPGTPTRAVAAFARFSGETALETHRTGRCGRRHTKRRRRSAWLYWFRIRVNVTAAEIPRPLHRKHRSTPTCNRCPLKKLRNVHCCWNIIRVVCKVGT